MTGMVFIVISFSASPLFSFSQSLTVIKSYCRCSPLRNKPQSSLQCRG